MAEKSNRLAARTDRAAMRCRIDAGCKSAYDCEPGARQMLCEFESISRATLGRVPAADDRERREVQNLGIPVDEQQQRRQHMGPLGLRQPGHEAAVGEVVVAADRRAEGIDAEGEQRAQREDVI